MLNISDKFADNADAILAIRLVSRDFYPIFELPLIIGPEERDSFKAALRRDDASWYPRWERFKGLSNLPRATCSACGSRHSKSQFSSQELAKDPENRVCIGTQEFLRMYEGQKASLNEIRDLGPDNFLKAGFQKAYVSKSSGTLDTHSSAPFLEAIIAHTFSARELKVTRHFRLLAIPKRVKLSKEDLTQPLLSIKSTLCSFLRVDELQVEVPSITPRSPQWKQPRSLDSLYDPYKNLYDPYNYAWIICWCWDEGKEDRCDSLLSLHRRQSGFDEETDEVVLSVYKDYRPSSDNADPGWADGLVRRLVDEQKALNQTACKDVNTVVYKAKGRGEWDWSEDDRVNPCEEGQLLG